MSPSRSTGIGCESADEGDDIGVGSVKKTSVTNRECRCILHARTERSVVITLVQGHIKRVWRTPAHDKNVQFPVEREIAWNDVVYRRCLLQLRALLERERIWARESRKATVTRKQACHGPRCIRRAPADPSPVPARPRCVPVDSSDKASEYACTHNWSPLKSPNAIIRSPSSNPMEPASMREFFVNRLGGKGHIDETGLTRSNIARRVRENCTVVLGRVRVRKEEKRPPSITVAVLVVM